MSGLVSGVGLVSGLPIADLVDQLIAVESGPYLQALQRVDKIKTQRVSFSDLNARLLGLKAAISKLDQSSFFRKVKATSSDPGVLSATTSTGAVPGTYSFRVRSLVTTHQLISSGFSDADVTAVGSGTLSLEVGHGKLSKITFLDDLNGEEGVGRGVIRVIDRAGHTADIDLTDALTVEDVLVAINQDSRVDVHASVSGDHFVLRDDSGGSGELSVSDVGSGSMAADLGIALSVSGPELIGSDIHDLSTSTGLNLLNDGNGVRHRNAGADLDFRSGTETLFSVALNDTLQTSTHLARLNDGNGVSLGTFEIRASDGSTFEVDLTAGDIQTVGDVIAAINAATGGTPDSSVYARLEPGTQRLQLVDNTDGTGSFEVVDLNGKPAKDLGLTAASDDGKITAAKLLRMNSLGDVVRAINFNLQNLQLGDPITVSVADNGLQIVRANGQEFAVEASEGSSAAEDLGILNASSVGGAVTSDQLLAGLNTVLLRSLNGGRGVDLTEGLSMTNKNGVQINVDLSGAQTVLDVIERINQAGETAGLRAQLNAAENGIVLIDETAGGGALSVAGGTTAEDLGLAGKSTTGKSLSSGNLQLQYISEATRLNTLNHGDGIGTGTMRITTSDDQTVVVTISATQQDVGDVIAQINNAGESYGISAQLNERGDGLLIRDASGGSGTLRVAEGDGQVARRLNLLGEARTEGSEQIIDGSFELNIDVEADDTLQDVAEKINTSGLGISATVINDGSSSNPFRLSVSSSRTGTRGELMFDAGETALAMSTLVRPQDAVVFFGGQGTNNPVVIRSSSNTLTDVVQNVTIDLQSTSEDPVELTVSKNTEAVVQGVTGFVDAYNAVIERIDELTFFDVETLDGGVLRGDTAVSRVRSRLIDMVSSPIALENGGLSRLAQLGISFGEGGLLEMDEERFREVLTQNPNAVEDLFAFSEVSKKRDANGDPVLDPETGEVVEEFVGIGLGYRMDDVLEQLTSGFDGLLTLKDESLQRQEDLFSARADDLLERLDSKRSRLEAKFAGLEQTLSQLSGQQTALSAIAAATPASLF